MILNWIYRANPQRRLDVHTAPYGLLAGLNKRIGRAQAERLKNIRVAAGVCTRAKLTRSITTS
jgi:hypothetical protein